MTEDTEYVENAALAALDDEDREELVRALRQWKAEGNPNPLIPVDADIDGDDVADSYGLDSFGNLIVVSGVMVEDTVSVSSGDGLETDWDGDEDG